MPASYEDAVGALHRAPHEAWVAERKRLAAELKVSGDKAGAARLAKLVRPPLSAWAVNQLWWRAPEAFGELFEAAARMRAGEPSAAPARRQALAALKARAAALLVEAGHAAGDATLRRVTTTLAALAAAGGFEPDLPGALAADREPPGFDTPGLAEALARSAVEPAEPTPAEPTAGEPAGSTGTPPQVADAAAALTRQAAARAPAVEPAESDQQHPAQAAREAARRNAELEVERRTAEARTAEARDAARREAERRTAEARDAEARRERERQARHAERQRLDARLVGLQDDLERREREVERLRGEVARVERLAQEARAAIAEAESELAALGPSD
jgi:colicin import membrane protein